MIDTEKLREINRKRREAGRRELSPAEARAALTRSSERDDSFDFLVGFATGIPMPSISGVVGSMLHHSSSYDSGSSSSSSYDSGSSGGYSD